ncbi:MAG: 23S rRNA (adenine(2503)-C(2))-methyltransferase RlmN [Mogibacterium sp.]|nr:23S rRNA (adenine(2503)-C(2))-methyltransferase RlmN [Mogibacterium sp.]
MPTNTKENILNISQAGLEDIVTGLGDKKFRAKQIFGWLAKGVTDFDMMTNVPATLRDKLSEGWYIGIPYAELEQRSKDGTVKCLFRFTDGTAVESVFMKYDYGNSICISSQAGCRMGCKFCASTMDGLERSLTGGEMLGEVLAMRNLTGEDINHVVIMGMGEPFDNYDEVARFIRLIHDPSGYGLSLRNITVSTCGIIDGIDRFAEDFPQVNLAISLHAPNQKMREQTMPVARKYEYGDLLKAAREYTEKTGRRITFEYAVIDGVNDSKECAEELSGHLKGWLTHVNLIPLNEVDGREYKKARGTNVKRFKDILESHGVAVTIRRTLGSDIDAACGQLRRRG